MDKGSKTMVIVTIFLLFILIIKSNIIDPVGPQNGDMEKYRIYTLQTSRLKSRLVENTGLLTYRAVKVKQDSIDGETEIVLREDTTGEWNKHTLKGQYSGKVRVYLFRTIPVKDINFRGGVIKDGKQNES